jgi:mannosyltransferase OCH1-like enzyme
VVYIYGGYYADLDVMLHKPFFEIIDSNISAVFTKEIDNIAN